jgi:hypothetical protein
MKLLRMDRGSSRYKPDDCRTHSIGRICLWSIHLERIKGIGIKLAVGSQRSYILTQFIFESLLLAMSGSTIGILFCYAGVSVVRMMECSQRFFVIQKKHPETSSLGSGVF